MKLAVVFVVCAYLGAVSSSGYGGGGGHGGGGHGGGGGGGGGSGSGTACIVKGSYCNCHYCKCEKGQISCSGYGHGGGYGECNIIQGSEDHLGDLLHNWYDQDDFGFFGSSNWRFLAQK